MTTGSTGSIFPKWKLAVLVGAPLAIGLTYLYYRKPDAVDADKRKRLADLKDQTISLDDAAGDGPHTTPTAPAKTPLEQSAQHKAAGNAAFKRGAYEEAIQHYDRAIVVCPPTHSVDLSTYYQNRAAAHEQLRQWSSVRDDCDRALALNPRYVKALHRRARANEYLNELFASLEDITATCILESFQNNSSLTFADRVLKLLGQRDAEQAMRTRVPTMPSPCTIRALYRAFCHDPLVRFELPAAAEPQLADSGFVRAKRAFDAGRYDDIIPACTDELDNGDGKYVDLARFARGTFHLYRGQSTEALLDLEHVVRNKSAPAKLRCAAHLKIATLLANNGNAAKAQHHFDEADLLDGDSNADVHYQRAQFQMTNNDLDGALQGYKRAHQLQPDNGPAYAQKCMLEFRVAQAQQNQAALIVVMSSFQEAIQRYPNSVECYNFLAQVLAEQQQYEQADHFFGKAIEVDPTAGLNYIHRGIAQLQWTGNIDKALEYMLKGIEVDEKCEFGLETLGTIEVQRGNLANAVDLFDRAIRLAQTEPELKHLFSLKNAALAQINVAKKMGLDMSKVLP